MEQVKIAIFASGKGSNAKALIEALRDRPRIEVALLLSDRKDAGVFKLAEKEGIHSRCLKKNELKEGKALDSILQEHGIHLIVLAGFFRKIPEEVIEAYRGRILNVHPALLPNFGGKGMYGDHVHRAVIDAGKEESGISIHRVDEIYDNGEILFQKKCPVLPDDTPDRLGERIKGLEHEHYPQVVIEEAEKLLQGS